MDLPEMHGLRMEGGAGQWEWELMSNGEGGVRIGVCVDFCLNSTSCSIDPFLELRDLLQFIFVCIIVKMPKNAKNSTPPFRPFR